MKNNEIFESVTNSILESLEKGEPAWVTPWSCFGAEKAVNATTGKAYRGINTLLLMLPMRKNGYAVSRWLTFKQAKAKGGTVRKGEKGTQVIFWRFLERENKASGEKEKFPMCRTYTVFNVAQCDGLPADYYTVKEIPVVTEQNDEIESFIAATGADIAHGGDRACYTPSLDKITMPEKGQFSDMGAYYATMLHELCHWTGNENRCKRMLGERFGKESYAAEELVAEIGSAYLCSEFGVQGRLQHAAYVQNWLTILRNDKHAIFKAASLAQEAFDYLMDKSGRRKAEEAQTGEEEAD
jgi:antirestriction protein ArdC